MRTPRILSLFCIALLAASVGCLGELTPLEGDDGPSGGGPDAGTANTVAMEYFQTNVQPLLSVVRPKGACNGCHQNTDAIDGPDFLGTTAADNYTTLVANTRLVGATPAVSIFVTRGDHTGNAWCTGAGAPYATCTQDEVAIVTAWINLEAQ